jgi:hypothetical protein
MKYKVRLFPRYYRRPFFGWRTYNSGYKYIYLGLWHIQFKPLV